MTGPSPAALLDLARRFGTPTFVYDGEVLAASLARLREAVGPGVGVLYSIKANPAPALVSRFRELGCGVEVASAGELELALACGVPPERIAYAGPGKTGAELELAVSSGLLSVQAESVGELRRIAAIARRLGRRAAVSLRVHPRMPAGRAGRARPWRGTTPFGIDEAGLGAALDALPDLPEIDVLGIHVHVSSQIADAEALGDILEGTAELAFALDGRIDLRLIDFGGGFRAPFYAGEEPLDPAPVRAALERIRERYPKAARGDAGNAGNAGDLALWVESGRALVGPCGWFVTTVVDVKACDGTRFAVVDGGIHQNLALSGAFRTVGKPVAVLACRDGGEELETEIVGPLCTPIDRLASRALLPADLAPGDVLAFANAGAYAKHASPLAFLGHDWPAEVLLEAGGVARPIARRVPFREILALQEVREA
jgi:diaminopimelate decarboxylase